MRPVRRAVAAFVVLPLLLAACTGPAGTDDGSGAAPVQTHVDVDTPQLRQAKQAAGIEDCAPGAGSPAADGLPDVTLPCLGGGPAVQLDRLRGPMVVNLWAQWCGPCREELPYYQRLHEEAGDRVAVLGIDWQDTRPDAALELAEQAGVTYPLLADPAAETKAELKVRGLPGVVFVDRDGTVRHVEYTVIRSYDQLRELVNQHLDVTV
ncbi:MAG TPA: TlpA disulfide reductase family protein [Nocardioidaceae bacterium]|nr:TlpA disulfide reductase family protein [Nocardioidaceae bacterium]